ncbi:MAG TPA: NADH-quinone oxidoreductase subunit A [Pirellulaceae bacterium]|nr:NADH-quinone oxidoreductase subunit A [Pirellulaceae bacterium]
MSSAMDSSLALVAYIALFASVGIAFLFANLLLGRFLRPNNPTPEKQEIYECGEPTIGSSYVQFDLRFYVVALVFIVFDVEVAFLFPWATVFGKSTNLMDERMVVATVGADGHVALTPAARELYSEMGIANPRIIASNDDAAVSKDIKTGARDLAVFSAGAMGLFFVVLLVGFAYEWKTGAFDWVRAVTRERSEAAGGHMVEDPLAEENFVSV